MSLNPFNFCIYYINITFIVNKDVTRYEIPYLILMIPKTSFFACFLKTKSCHIGIYHDASGRMGIRNSWLNDNRLHSPSVKSGKAIERISGIRKNCIVHQKLM